MIKKLFLLLAAIGVLASCIKEDPRASDFEIVYEMKDARWKSQWVEGYVKNYSTTPATKIRLQVKMYEGLVHQETRYEKIKESLFMGDSAKFCVTVGDTISSVDIIIVKRE